MAFMIKVNGDIHSVDVDGDTPRTSLVQAGSRQLRLAHANSLSQVVEV
jgi:hypothetical protein